MKTEIEIINEIESTLLQDLQHHEFCKVKGEQFRECARCYVERKLSNLKSK